MGLFPDHERDSGGPPVGLIRKSHCKQLAPSSKHGWHTSGMCWHSRFGDIDLILEHGRAFMVFTSMARERDRRTQAQRIFAEADISELSGGSSWPVFCDKCLCNLDALCYVSRFLE